MVINLPETRLLIVSTTPATSALELFFVRATIEGIKNIMKKKKKKPLD